MPGPETGTPFVVLLFALDRADPARGGDRGRQARADADGRRLGRRGASPRAGGRGEPRRDRLRVAGRLADRLHPRGAAGDRDASSSSAGTRRRLAEFCRAHDCEPAELAPRGGRRTTSSSRSRPRRTRCCAASGSREGALVCAVGANDPAHRELDNAVLERAAFVCCDSREQSRLESGDLIEPVERGVLDWLEVHELQDVVAARSRAAPSARGHRRLQVERDGRLGSGGRARACSSLPASAASASSSSASASGRSGGRDDVVAEGSSTSGRSRSRGRSVRRERLVT